jgi:DNA-3-methyladenine glycosylase I
LIYLKHTISGKKFPDFREKKEGKGAKYKLFKKTFKFTGGEITGEFLMSIGYLPSPHRENCPTFRKIALLKPPWMENG